MSMHPWTLTREHFLNEDEVRHLLAGLEKLASGANAPNPIVDRLIVETLLWSGLQPSEFCRLRIKDVCLNKAHLAVRGKRDKQRLVHLPARVCALLDQYVTSTRTQLLTGNDFDASDALILNQRGRPYERTALYRRVTRILTTHGLGDRASVQLLRHTYGYMAYKYSGCNLLFAQRQLGHAHPMVTAVYAQFVEEDYATVANDVAAAVFELPKVANLT